jgi:hypothetical protein
MDGTLFFADDIAFGVQASNIAEAMQVSSTTNNVFMRLFTNNGSDVDNLTTGYVIGSSNIRDDITPNAVNNNLYMGYIVNDSIGRILTLQSNECLIDGNIIPTQSTKFDIGSMTDKYNAIHCATVQVDQITTEYQNINCSLKSFSNVDTVHAIKLTAPSTTIDIDANTFSNVGNIKMNASSTLFVNSFSTSLDSAALSMRCLPALRILGFDSELLGGSNIIGTAGSTNDTTQIGLRVDNNILGQAFLSVSDRRIKTDILQSSSSIDLETLLQIPVVRYSFIEGTEGCAKHPTIGFLAQDVEIHAPYAVRTTIGCIPNIMEIPKVIEDGNIIVLQKHSLVSGSVIKVLVDNVDTTMKVIDVTNEQIRLCTPIRGQHIFVYGEMVSDFKLLDNERILPLVFNAVKELHSQQTAMQNQIKIIESSLSNCLSQLASLTL